MSQWKVDAVPDEPDRDLQGGEGAEVDEMEPPPASPSGSLQMEQKRYKRGVLYISYLPQGMTPPLLRDSLSRFAPMGRMYMQKVKEKGEKKRTKKGAGWFAPDNFSEGWIEFLRKRDAKKVAALLNNQPMGGKKDKFHDHLWNLKYLSRFKWIHLVERLSYERAVTRQKMQNEISQAKRVANFFKETVEKEERQRRRTKKRGGEEEPPTLPSPYVFTQKMTHDERKAGKTRTDDDREKFLKSLFAS